MLRGFNFIEWVHNSSSKTQSNIVDGPDQRFHPPRQFLRRVSPRTFSDKDGNSDVLYDSKLVSWHPSPRPSSVLIRPRLNHPYLNQYLDWESRQSVFRFKVSSSWTLLIHSPHCLNRVSSWLSIPKLHPLCYFYRIRFRHRTKLPCPLLILLFFHSFPLSSITLRFPYRIREPVLKCSWVDL